MSSIAMDSKEFRRVMGLFGTGVTIVTIPEEEKVHGMTANSFTSVSLDPPLILISVDKRAKAHDSIQMAGRFGVSFLLAEQENVSSHFAGRPDPEVEKQIHFDWMGDIPVLSHGLAQIACRLWASYEGGDHTLYVGLVEELKGNVGTPLLYYQGSYRKIHED